METQTDNGSFVDITSSLGIDGAFTFDPGTLIPGLHRITVRATDTGNQAIDTLLEFRVNAPPVPNAGGPRAVNEGESVDFDGSGSSDADAPIFFYEWRFPDGTTAEGSTSNYPFPQNGTFAVDLSVTDTAGSIVHDTAVIAVHNLPAAIDPISNQQSAESQAVTFTTTFSDPGVLDTHSATVDWGDGTLPEPAPILEQNGVGTVSGTHSYKDDGLYSVTVRVTDSDGDESNTSFDVLVSNLAPTVITATDLTGEEGQSLDFVATFTDAGVLDTHTATVSWSDGTQSVGTVVEADGSGTVTAPHVFADNGVYPIRIDVTDNAGDTGSRTASGTISNVDPTVVAATSQTFNEGESFLLNVATFSDPGFTLSSAGTQETFTASIDWGDGAPAQTGTLSVVMGSAGVITTGTVSGTHAYANNGQYTVNVTITDDDGGIGTASFLITVRNLAPTVISATDLTGTEGQSLNFSATFTDGGVLDTHMAIVSWSDGTQTVGTVVEANGSGTVTAPHVFADNGVYPIRIDVTDNAGDTGSRNATGTVDNVDPTVAAATNQTFNEGESFLLNVATFSDPGFTLPAAGTQETFTANINWGDGTPVQPGTLVVVMGSAGVVTTGTVSGTHTYAQNGQYSANVTITDDDGGVGTATFLVTVRNLAPTILTAGNLTGTEGQSLNFSATFTDRGVLDTHTATVSWSDGTQTIGTVVEVNGSGTVTAAHVFADNGVYPIRVDVTDNASDTGSRNATGTVSNVDPTVVAATDQIFNEGESFLLNVATFSEPGFTLPSAGTQETFTASINWGDSTPVQAGTLVVVMGAAGIATTGIVSGTHTYATNGQYTVTVTVTDDDGGAGSAQFGIQVVAATGTKFFVVDQSAHSTFRYGVTGNALGQSDLNNSRPRGVASNVAGDTVWVIDANKRVYVYNAAGVLLGSWQANGINQPQDITTDGTNIWIVDDAKNMVYRYANAASRRSGSQSPSSSFRLAPQNKNASGIVTNGTTLWITDDHAHADQVYVYDLAGRVQGQWNLDSANDSPSGITLDPSGGNDLWVVDRNDAVVYHYANSIAVRAGSRTAADSFRLAANNHHPEGIADPPPAGPIELSFGTLPSAQGWHYESQNNSEVETRVFAVDGSTLHQDSIGVGFQGQGSNRYIIDDVVDPLLPFTVSFRARVLQEEGNVGANSSGFGIAVYSDTNSYNIGLGAHRIEDGYSSRTLSTSIDATIYHDYRLVGIPGVAGDFFVDDVRIGSVVPFQGDTTGTNSLHIGDRTGGTNARADVTYFRFSQPAYFVHVNATSSGMHLSADSTTLISGRASSVRSDGGPGRAIQSVAVNGIPVDALDASGNFFARVHVAPGQNNFDIIATDVGGLADHTFLTLEGVQRPSGEIDFSLFSDVSASFTADYARTSVNDKAKLLYADWAIRNAGQYPADVPLYVGVTNISDPRVRVHDPAGQTPDGVPFFDFTPLVADGRLSPSEVTGTASLSFFNPEQIQFTYDLVFFGLLNRAPAITSIPDVEALAGRPYLYDTDATDPEGDAISWSLVTADPRMQIDSATGLISWTPTSADIGATSITVRAEDGRGGSSEQRYVLSVITAPPNRPPVFTSVPVVAANVNTPYAYDADATDPDGDTLVYSLVTGPTGLAIDSGTGQVHWTPISGQVGTHDLSVRVIDGHGGIATQSFVLLVQQEPGNHSPIIVSDPVTTAITSHVYTYDVDAIDPDNDPLTYSLTDGPVGAVIFAVRKCCQPQYLCHSSFPVRD